MFDAIGGLKIIRSFGTERQEAKAFALASGRVARDFLRLNAVSSLSGPIFEVLSSLVLLALLLSVVLENPGSLATTTVFMLLLFRMQPNVRQLIGDVAALCASRSFVENVFSFVDEAPGLFVFPVALLPEDFAPPGFFAFAVGISLNF